MSEPIVFVSHFRIKEGQLEALRRMSADSTERLRAQKPRTVLFLSYIDEEQGVVSFYTRSRTPTRWTSTSRVPTSGRRRRTN
jgi:hypothetical protein